MRHTKILLSAMVISSLGLTFSQGRRMVIQYNNGSSEKKTVEEISKIYFEDDEDLSDIPANAVNLSANGTANCYIVTPGTTIVFDAAYKGNSTTLSIGDATASALLWQTAPDLVSDLEYHVAEKKISAVIADKEGNALVAAKDASGNILWSWHLWIVDYDPANDYTTPANANGTTWTFMDRNLGALSSKPNWDSHGMFYQWGRKDPFPGAATYTVMNEDYTYAKDGEPTLYDIDGNPIPKFNSLAQPHGTLALSIANPTVFYINIKENTGEFDEYGDEIWIDDWFNGDWVQESSDDYWGGVSMEKSIYDPSPVGYKIPVCDAGGATPYDWLIYDNMTWDSVNQGAMQNGQWFPATGTRVYASGSLDFPEGGSPYSGLWIGTKGTESSNLELYPTIYGQYMFIINGKRTFKTSKDRRSQGMSVRCVRE